MAVYVPTSVLPGLTCETFLARTESIYGLYQEFGGVTVLRVEESLAAELGRAHVSDRLGVARTAPLLLVQRTAFSFDDAPVEFRYRWVNPRAASYRNAIGLRGT